MTGPCLVIVPAWNEAASVGRVVAELRETLPDVDVLVVDDGSVDETAAVAAAAGAQVARLPFNLGVGGAMRLGYKYAARRGYQHAVQVDADGQHDPAYVKVLLDRLDTAAGDGADLVIGARFAGTGDYVVRGPRRWAMVALSRVISRLAGIRLTDTTSGFRAANRPVIELFARRYPVDYLGDTVETLIVAIRAGHRVAQVPVAMRPRAAGTPSQSPMRSAVYLGRAAIVLLLALVRR